MTQMALFDADTVPTPKWLCPYDRPCETKGRAVWGAPVAYRACVNRVCTCVTCGRYGEESVRTA